MSLSHGPKTWAGLVGEVENQGRRVVSFSIPVILLFLDCSLITVLIATDCANACWLIFLSSRFYSVCFAIVAVSVLRFFFLGLVHCRLLFLSISLPLVLVTLI